MRHLTEQLATCNTAGLFDVLRIHGLPVHELPREIRGLDPSMKLAGPVFTVTGRADPSISVTESLELFISKVLSGRLPATWWYASRTTMHVPRWAIWRPNRSSAAASAAT